MTALKPCCSPCRSDQGVHTSEIPSTAPAEIKPAAARQFADNLVSLPGGRFLMGTDDPDGWASDIEGPVREVEISPFFMDATVVTNGQFAAFVEATGYHTEAEEFKWSYVFVGQLPKAMRRKSQTLDRSSEAQWWIAMRGAHWACPEGLDSNIEGRANHPAVHISHSDALAFCKWAGKRLPTEAEWEYAARGGLVQKKYPWGDELTPGGVHHCNIWQGKFPEINRPEDGYLWAAPVQTYQPNGFGLYQMSGNVWEWCADFWGTKWQTTPVPRNPTGPASGKARVIRGGSFLCHKSYCNRYRVAARSKCMPDSTSTHKGFRCAADITSNL